MLLYSVKKKLMSDCQRFHCMYIFSL